MAIILVELLIEILCFVELVARLTDFIQLFIFIFEVQVT